MTYIGEFISIAVAFSWTATALLSEAGSKRLGNLTLNVLRMALALIFSMILFWIVMGSPLPSGGSFEAYGGMMLYYHWFTLRPVVHDTGSLGSSMHGLADAGTGDVNHEHSGHANYANRYQHLYSRQRQTP